MEIAQNIIGKLPLFLQKAILKILYKRNNLILEDFTPIKKGQFYIYKVSGIYLPFESIVWYLTLKNYENRVLEYASFAYKPKSGETVIDIGAGMGEESIAFAAWVGDKGHVHAIEANPDAFNVLQQVQSLNNIEALSVYNIAINNQKEKVLLDADPGSFITGFIKSKTSQQITNSFEVQGLRMDQFIEENKIGQIDLLKVNIEGAERFVIETMGDYIANVKNVSIACHDFRFRNEGGNEFFKTKVLVESYLIKNGFKIFSPQTGKEYFDDYVFGSRN